MYKFFRTQRSFWLLILVLAASGCSALQTATEEPRASLEIKSAEEVVAIDAAGKAAAKQELRSARKANEVAPGFLIQLTSLEDEKLNGKYRINADGILKLPYNIKVQTAGMSQKQLSDSVLQGYKKFFKAQPNIEVTVVEKWYWLDVRGLVEKPGPFLVKPDTSLDQIIAEAGGLQENQDGAPLAKYVRIRQMGSSTTIKLNDYYSGSELLVPQWTGGDTIFFQSNRGEGSGATGVDQVFVQVLGEVREPGEYRFRDDADFFDYLVTAGGPTEKADLSRIMLVREDGETRKAVRFEVDDLETIPVIEGGDIIIIRSDTPWAEDRKVQKVTTFTSIFSSLATVALLAAAL